MFHFSPHPLGADGVAIINIPKQKPMKTKIIAFTIFGFLLFPTAFAQSSTASIEKKTFVYKTVGTLPIEADLYQTTDGTGLKPVIIWIHGGALMGGSRAGLSEVQKKLYLEAGYSIVAIDYRLAPSCLQLSKMYKMLLNGFVKMLHPY